MFLKSVSILAISSIFISQNILVLSNTITCDSNNGQSCFNQVVTCDPGESCSVYCKGTVACRNSRINCADDYPCAIFLQDNSRAIRAKVFGNGANVLDVIIEDGSSIGGGRVDCPNPLNYNSPFLITCKISVDSEEGASGLTLNAINENVYVFLSVNTNGEYGFEEAEINAQGANSVRLYSVAPNAYFNAIVNCPDDGAAREQCVIDMPSTDATGSLEGLRVRAIEGLNDFGVDGFIPSSLDVGEFTLTCGEDVLYGCTATYDQVEQDLVCLSESECSDIVFTNSPTEEPTLEPQIVP